MCRGRGRGRPMQRERAGSHEERRSDTPKVSCQATTGVRCGARWGRPGRRGSTQMRPGGRAPGGGKRNSMGRRDQVQRGARKEGGRCDVPVWIRRCTHKSGLEKAPSSRADLRSAGRIVEPGRRCYFIIQPVYLRCRTLEILSLKFIVAAVYLCICFRLVRTSSLCWDLQRDGADRVQSPAGPWQRPPATLRAATLGERSSECQAQEPGAGYE